MVRRLTIAFVALVAAAFAAQPARNGPGATPDDRKYSIERFMAKSGFRARFEVVQSIDVVDRHTLRVTLKEPFAPFLNHLAASTYLAILPREVEEKFKDFNRPEAMIGTGPFMLKSYQKGVQIAFEKNPDYHVKGLPYLDGAVMEMTPVMILGSGILYFRTDQPPFNDVRVRRAISLAIDRKSWNDSLHFGEGCVDSGPVPCALTDWKLPASKMDPAKAKYLVGYDPVEAKRLPAEAGFPKGFTTPMYHWPGYATPWRTYFDLAADDLAKIGVTVEFKPE